MNARPPRRPLQHPLGIAAAVVLTLGILNGLNLLLAPRDRAMSGVSLEELVGRWRQSLPKMLDSETEVVEVHVVDRVLVFTYRMVHYSVDDFDADVAVRGRPDAVQGACQKRDYREVLVARETGLRFIYTDRDGAHIATYDVAPEDCAS